MGQLGMQLTPWTDSRQLVGLARRLSDVADIMWVQDQMLARNVYALLGAIARLWPDLERVGLDIESAGAVKNAFDQGLGIDGAAAQCSAALADALIISGTPDECIPAMAELRDLAAAEGYTDFYVGAPLGPDPGEAVDHLAASVVPALWPGHGRAGSYRLQRTVYPWPTPSR
jgi:5,10-methylenetetrahydromethanopterin reductase